jgi:hypothetical protein
MKPTKDQVRLRVAGIYYDQLFDIDVLTPNPHFKIPGRTPLAGGQPTILELLEAARRNPGPDKDNFNYVFERREITLPDGKPGGEGLSLTSITVEHTKEIRSLGGNHRPAGIYQLTEIAIPCGVVAWQSYVYRNGISETQDDPKSGSGYSPVIPTKGGFLLFDQTPIEGGDEVIWRQVAILREPNVPKKPKKY